MYTKQLCTSWKEAILEKAQKQTLRKLSLPEYEESLQEVQKISKSDKTRDL